MNIRRSRFEIRRGGATRRRAARAHGGQFVGRRRCGPLAPERVCSVLYISGARTDVICLSRDTFEPKGAGLVVLRHHPQPLCSIRMRNLARDASTQGGMIQ